MPTPDYNAIENPENTVLNPTTNACPAPLTPPSEQPEQDGLVQTHNQPEMMVDAGHLSDNTGAGMAQRQEDSMYLTPAGSPGISQEGFEVDDQDKMEIVHDACKDGTMTPKVANAHEINDVAPRLDSVSAQSSSSPDLRATLSRDVTQHDTNDLDINSLSTGRRDNKKQVTGLQTPPDIREDISSNITSQAISKGLAPVDLTLDWTASTKPWTFSHKRMVPKYPSCVFQAFSRYTGTQQSDRQTYNVDVTILTVDVEQCTLTGYLLIKGLTPEHDTLQTYFTGEIIGGPSKFSNGRQAYTFRTSNPAWGATEKTDLTHWARFPAWRSFNSHARSDINFAFPLDGENWWEQENVFMRWKEHFLVPDHKTKSIAGASFEGFYYICLNQLQGRISGIYYHAKSEKYQQLELKHEGKPDLFNRGVIPALEFR